MVPRINRNGIKIRVVRVTMTKIQIGFKAKKKIKLTIENFNWNVIIWGWFKINLDEGLRKNLII